MNIWRDRRVLVTGHTGFKGSWLCLALHQLGAHVTGLALDPEAGPSAFSTLGVARLLAADHRVDIRDAPEMARYIRQAAPQIVFHLAAQALVGRGYEDPAGTFATNVAGTINLMEASRDLPDLEALVIVTSDKVYANDGSGRAFVEGDPLGGHDPYSASKAAVEIAVAAWRHSFGASLPPIATARAGNVIGGGDFGEARLIPDLVRASIAGVPLQVRRLDATRPFQHVADVIRGYLLLAEALRGDAAPAAVNFGPADGEIRVRDLLALWGEPVAWHHQPDSAMPEAARLGLDASLAAHRLGWRPRLSTPAAIAETSAWYAFWRAGGDTLAHARATLAAVA